MYSWRVRPYNEGNWRTVVRNDQFRRGFAWSGLVLRIKPKSMTARRGKILLVEDEQSLLYAVSRMFEKTGYAVLQATDGNAAVELLRRHRETVTLMLLDVTLPGLSSRDVLLEARRIRPDITVILTSALSVNEVSGSFAGLQVDHFIRKPYRLAVLIELLQRVCPTK